VLCDLPPIPTAILSYAARILNIDSELFAKIDEKTIGCRPNTEGIISRWKQET
jgi:hypothetical protein